MGTLADRLAELLIAKKLNPTQLARKTGIAQPIIHRLLNGQTNNPQLATLLTLAEFFEVEIDVLIGRKRGNPLLNLPQLKLPEAPLFSFEWFKEDPLRQETVIDKAIPSGVFAVHIEDQRFSPFAEQGNYLFVDREFQANNFDYVLIQIHKQNVLTIRQLIIDAGQHYLRPIPPQLPSRSRTDSDKIWGVVTHVIHCSASAFKKIQKEKETIDHS